jgi:hypothetical protein
MTETTIRTRTGIAARISLWVRRCQHELSARTRAAGDDRAERYGWNVTETTGRFGFEARSYRDPRFDDRRRQLAPEAGALGTRNEAAPAREAGE